MAELRILSAGAVKGGVARAAEAFARDHGHRIRLEFATAPELRARVEAGERADVVVAPPAIMDALAEAGHIVPDSRRFVGRARMGIVVHAQSSFSSASDVQSFKQMLCDAAFVVHNRASSGIYAAKLLRDLQIADVLGSRIAVVDTGAAVMEYVAEHPPAAVGLAQISEIRVLIEKGLPIRFAGPLPYAVQNVTSYDAAAFALSPHIATAKSLANYFATPDARKIFAATGID